MATVDEVFSVVALFILFRETIEASIICGVLLQFLNRSTPRLKPAVWWGVSSGVGTSIVFGVIFVVVFYVAKNNLFSGNNKDIFMGVICFIAVIMITYLGFKMLCFVGWEDKWKRRLEKAAAERLAKQKEEAEARAKAEKDAVLAGLPAPGADADNSSRSPSTECSAPATIATPSSPGAKDVATLGSPITAIKLDKTSSEATSSDAVELAKDVEAAVEVPQVDMSEPSRKEWWNIWFLVWTTVTREGIESVVFLCGVGASVKFSAIPLAGFVGIVLGVSFGMFLYYTGKQVKDLKWFLIGMGVVVFFIAAGQVSIGIDALMRAGMFGYCSPWIADRPKMMQPVWDISECCGDLDAQNKFFALMRAIFGYQDQPTPIEIIWYLSYWVLIISIMIFKWRQGSLFDADYKYKREQKRLAAEQVRLAGMGEVAVDGEGARPALDLAPQESMDVRTAEALPLTQRIKNAVCCVRPAKPLLQ